MTGARRGWQSTGRNMLRILPVLIMLALWQFASATGVLPKSLMPSLFEVGRALAGLIASGEISRIRSRRWVAPAPVSSLPSCSASRSAC